MAQRKLRAAYMQAKQWHKTEALPFRLLCTTFPIAFSWLSNFNGCSSTPRAFVSRNDNRGFYNRGAHPCFLDLRRKKKYIKPCFCVLNEVCSGYMSARVCVCKWKPADIFERCGGRVGLGTGEGRGAFQWSSQRGRFRRRSHQKRKATEGDELERN